MGIKDLCLAMDDKGLSRRVNRQSFIPIHKCPYQFRFQNGHSKQISREATQTLSLWLVQICITYRIGFLFIFLFKCRLVVFHLWFPSFFTTGCFYTHLDPHVPSVSDCSVLHCLVYPYTTSYRDNGWTEKSPLNGRLHSYVIGGTIIDIWSEFHCRPLRKQFCITMFKETF